MSSATTSDENDYGPAIWILASFTVSQTYKSHGPSRLYLDRANGEFGVVSMSPHATPTMAQFPDDEPIYFEGKCARAAAWRSKCKKVVLLFEHCQVDLEFAAVDSAHDFLHAVEDIAMGTGNNFFYSYEVPSGIPFVRADFDMVKHNYVDRTPHPVPAADSEWSQLRQSGEWADFTIIAEGRSFSVHRVRLCTVSLYFKAVCSGGFAESQKQSIELPESSQTISALLDEIYDTYNSTTGSVFTNFALRPEMEKEQAVAQLLDLFIASDKYNLEKIKRKVSYAIIDRLPFIKDPLMVIEIATNIYHEQHPFVDHGLRRAIIVQIDARMPTIIGDEGAWKELMDDKKVLKALHVFMCEGRDDDGEGGVLTPPVTPVRVGRK
ncbi:hypothetical protein DE146DRAFT_675082 [Phaeosphaeria sp. MPI-PUGE-AT-0046c]|nr:hypothetical protein DE146DRAFT_675082 [Phaeosphaeria sp. MPI-PUGE-AT-0046c]